MPPKRTVHENIPLNLDNLDLSKLSNDGKIIVKLLSDEFNRKIEDVKTSFEKALADRDLVTKKLREDFDTLKNRYPKYPSIQIMSKSSKNLRI